MNYAEKIIFVYVTSNILKDLNPPNTKRTIENIFKTNGIIPDKYNL